MKKLYLLLLMVPILLFSCTKDSATPLSGEGSLKINGSVNKDWNKVEATTRAETETIVGYTLSIEGENTSFTYSEVVAESGSVLVENIPAGSYTIGLNSHPDGMGDPKFDYPIYGITEPAIEISSGATRNLSLECTQANTGVYFVFDPALEEAGFIDLVPTITDANGKALIFNEKSDKEIEGTTKLASRTGHFTPGNVEFTLKNGDVNVSIGGKTAQTLNFEKKQLWEVTLKPKAVTKGGSVEITAVVKVIDSATDHLVFEVGGSAEAQEYELSPLAEEQSAYVDTYLELTFSSTPAVGEAGIIAIYKTDGTLVDKIDLSDDFVPRNGDGSTSSMIDYIGVTAESNGGRKRLVNYYPVTVSDNTIKIKPHSNVLEYNTEYYVTIDESVIKHDEFKGIEANKWTFKTKAEAPSITAQTLTVSSEGDADFRTVQGAIDYACLIGKDEAVTVEIKNGIYEEMLYLRGKNNLTLKGESRDGVIIRYDNCDALNAGTGGSNTGDKINGGRCVFLVETSGGLRLENLTLQNSHEKTGTGDQAEAIYYNCSTHTLVFVNCNIISKQDTINIKAYSWFYNCMIEGDVDFVWGSPYVALFEECELRTATTGGYLVQARVANANDKGFVFLNCSLTKAAGVANSQTYLARSAHETKYFDNIAYINCKMDNHIAPEGWLVDAGKAPNPETATFESGWKEFGSTDMSGTPLDLSTRLVGVQYQLTQEEYEAKYKDRTAVMQDYVDNTSKSLDWMGL